MARVPSASLPWFLFKKNNFEIGLYLNICFQLLFIEEISVEFGKPDRAEIIIKLV